MLVSELAYRLIDLVEGKRPQERHQVYSFHGREGRSQIQAALLGISDVAPDPVGKAFRRQQAWRKAEPRPVACGRIGDVEWSRGRPGKSATRGGFGTWIASDFTVGVSDAEINDCRILQF